MTDQTPDPQSAATADGPELAAFAATLDFSLDTFQIAAGRALESGAGVLVCAPTGSGKTVVGEFAVHLALGAGGKCFYTTPIKALSNQKYHDLVAVYGEDAVGLLTGDQSINGHAPVVVMTTEVLRNMIYAQSSTLTGLTHVVMDEIHYLADRSRGPVWEEVILGLPDQIRIVGLSATVSNAEEFGAWIQEVRGDAEVIVDEHRPVPLYQHVLVSGRLFDLFGQGSKVNPELMSFTKKRRRDIEAAGRGRDRFRPTPRPRVLERLRGAGLLPAITFIFSRAGCDAAVDQCLRSNLRLTDDKQARQIARIIDKHTGALEAQDKAVLGYDAWREGLMRGFAAHHAGMLPIFRHTVEELFEAGLVPAVFATETLALGINMPARSVVLERLVKFNGETHADLTPGEYTQLTGRAGRRGIDVEGHAVVQWTPLMDLRAVAGLASTRTYPLRSAFQPAYNMTVNLVRTVGVSAGRALIERSFAQFQSDRGLVGLARRIERNTEAMDGYGEHLDCHLGDFAEYDRLRRQVSERERALERQTRAERRADTVAVLAKLRRGDVVAISTGRRAGLAVVVHPDSDRDDPAPTVINEDRWSGQVRADDFRGSVQVLGSLGLPRRLDPRSGHDRRSIAEQLRHAGIRRPRRTPHRRKSAAGGDRELAALRRELRDHPVADCPELSTHIRWAERHRRLKVETERMIRRRDRSSHSLARAFDRIVEVLIEFGYLDRTGGDVTVTEAGELLAAVHSDSALVVTEALRTELWRGLEPADLAAVVSSLVYQSRSDGYQATAAVPPPVEAGLRDLRRLWLDIAAAEDRHSLPITREPDSGFAAAIGMWIRQDPLIDVLFAGGDGDRPLTPGDFVRWCRQVVDLLDQIRQAGDDPQLRSAATAAIRGIRRGIVTVDAVG